MTFVSKTPPGLGAIIPGEILKFSRNVERTKTRYEEQTAGSELPSSERRERPPGSWTWKKM